MPESVSAKSERAEQRSPLQLTPDDGIVRWGLEPKISQRLERLGRAAGATYFVLRLAAFVALLAFETGQRDILLGSYITNRNRLALQSIHGFFVNLLALRFEYNPTKSFREWLAIVRKGVTDSEMRSRIPFECICDELERSGMGRPPIEVIFQTSHNARQMELADLKLIWMERHRESMPWEFSMNPDEHAEQFDCRATFDANTLRTKRRPSPG